MSNVYPNAAQKLQFASHEIAEERRSCPPTKTAVPVINTKPRTDASRASRRGASLANAVVVHKATQHCTKTDEATVAKVAKKLGISVRSVWRIIRTLRETYKEVRSELLD